MPLLTTRTTGLPAGVSGGDGQAYTRNVQSNELSANHLGALLSGQSDYRRSARLRGTEFAASRLLGNSSIAAGASERAAIESAAPFALQGADAYGRAASENLGFLNQYEIADRQNETSIEVANIGRSATLGAARINADSAMRQLEAQLSFAGQQADLDRAQQIMMSNLVFDQNLQTMAAQHGFDLDAMAAGAFYDLQQIAAVDSLNVRDAGMSFIMGAYNNYTQMMGDAMMGDFDTAAFARLVQSANNYLSNSIAFGHNLFGNFPAFDFQFTGYGDGG